MPRKSHVVSSVYAFAHSYNQHDYNAHPVAPFGSAVELHITPKNLKTSDSHTKKRYYLAMS